MVDRSPAPAPRGIVRTAFAHTLRRRWKLALGVLLLGAAVAVMTNAMDLIGIVDEIPEAVENVATEDEEGEVDVSAEQVGALASNVGALLLFGALALLFSFATLVVGFVMPGDMVAEERGSGSIMNWAQHPMPLTSFYMRRYLGVQAANLVAQTLFAAAAALAVTPGAIVLADLGVFLRSCLGGLLACAVTFALTALGLRRAAFVALAYYLGSRLLGGIVGLVAADGGSFAWVATALRLLVFPAGPLQDFGAGVRTGDWDWEATGLILYHFAVWTGLAWFGLRRLARRPLAL